jgi:hypothetical protein
LGAIAGRIHYLDEASALHMLTGAGSFRLHQFTGQHERREDDLAIGSAEAVAPVNHLFHSELFGHARR